MGIRAKTFRELDHFVGESLQGEYFLDQIVLAGAMRLYRDKLLEIDLQGEGLDSTDLEELRYIMSADEDSQSFRALYATAIGDWLAKCWETTTVRAASAAFDQNLVDEAIAQEDAAMERARVEREELEATGEWTPI